MKINGVYVGLGEGDTSDEIVKIKALLKKKFTPARNTLDDGPLFTAALTVEVNRVQGVYTKEGKQGAPHYIPGVINLEFKYDVGLLARPAKTLPIIFTVEGHMSNMFFGPTASTASALEAQGLCHWKPVNYDCTSLPFKNQTGVDALYELYSSKFIEGPPVDPNNPDGPKIMWPFPAGTPSGLMGFSQGSMVVSEFLMQHVIPEGADLHWRLPDLKRTLCFGNPRREKNKECAWARSPVKAGTEGVMGAGGLFITTGTALEGRHAEHANTGDMFAENGEDKEGLDKTAIAKIICENSWAGGPSALLARVLALFGNPTGEALQAILAAFSAIMFLAKNPNPHYSTTADPGDIEWMRAVAA